MTSAHTFKILFLSIFLLPALALANPGNERRIALVIGNQSYGHVALKNPINDANDMAEALKACGFEVTKKTDVNRLNLRLAVREFGQKLGKGDVGLFYYSGHGFQIGGGNYLVPIGFDVTEKYDIEDQCMSLSYVLHTMAKTGNKMNIVIFDASLDNPFRSFRGGEKEPAQVRAPCPQMAIPSGSYVALATSPGSTASDGPGSHNGLFTSKVLTHLKTPGLRMVDLFMRVRKEVLAESNQKQEPVSIQSITEPFYFMDVERVIANLQEELKQARTDRDQKAAALVEMEAVLKEMKQFERDRSNTIVSLTKQLNDARQKIKTLTDTSVPEKDKQAMDMHTQLEAMREALKQEQPKIVDLKESQAEISDEIRDYFKLIFNKVSANWEPPSELKQRKPSLEAIYVIRIDRSGQVIQAWFQKESGEPLFDTFAKFAVEKSSFDPLPKEYPEPVLEVALRFTLRDKADSQ